MEASKGGIKREAQMLIRSAKAAILLSSLNRQLRSVTIHPDYQSDGNEVVKSARKVEDLKLELDREKVKNKRMDRGVMWMEFLLLQIPFIIILTFVIFFNFSFTFNPRI